MDLSGYIQHSSRASRTLADAIAETLRQAILAGALEDGEVLRQGELAERFGVSRVALREALLKLEMDGLVQTRPRHGTVVTALDISAFVEILEMRFALEPLALRLAVPGLDAARLQRCEELMGEAQAQLRGSVAGAARAGAEFEARWGEANWAFHRTLYEAAERPRLIDTIKNLNLLFARHLRTRLEIVAPALLPGSTSGKSTEAVRHEWEAVLAEHRAILEACRARDAAHAVRLLEHHISVHGDELVRRLQS